jgi:hypothetical protein
MVAQGNGLNRRDLPGQHQTSRIDAELHTLVQTPEDFTGLDKALLGFIYALGKTWI